MHPFGGEPNSVTDPRFALIPVPYERTATYRKGTGNGPAALLAASTQVELYDEETGCEPLDEGVATLDPVTSDRMPDVLAQQLDLVCTAELQRGRIVGCLGGEHSISLGPIRAALRRNPGMGVLQVDAHPDLREEYEGTRFGHGCVMRRVLDENSLGALVQVGLRAVSDEDVAAQRVDPRVHPFHAFAMAAQPREQWIGEVVERLPQKIYVSFDLDGFDPSVVPGTGTPEPGGLGWWDAMALLRAVAEHREVVAFDVVELLPEPPSCVSDFAAAKLVLKLLAYVQAGRA